MEVYFGGAFQGKLDYVLKKKGNLKVADGRDCDEKRLQSADVVNHLHLLIQRRENRQIRLLMSYMPSIRR